MSTRDPFLRHLLSVVDRALVWGVLAIALTALTWSVTWDRGLGLPVLDGWRLISDVLLGRETDRTTRTLLALCSTVGMTGATIIGGFLFRRWKRRAELDAVPLRGSRWEADR